MWIDILSVVTRALSFIALFQAAGAAVFLAIFPLSIASETLIAKLGKGCAIVGAVLVLLHHLLEAGRMAGEFSGVFDFSLQQLSIASSTGAANAVRIVGLLMLAAGLRSGASSARKTALTGAVLACAAFALTGHTAVHAQRGLLAPLLLLHLFVVAFWFGALLPLFVISKCEASSLTADIVARFSALAFWLVPLIALAGIAMAVVLLPDLHALVEPYGLLLLAKLLGFAALMSLAALNKWRFGPKIASGDFAAMRSFRRAVLAEFAVICVVLGVTAIMTALFSPDV